MEIRFQLLSMGSIERSSTTRFMFWKGTRMYVGRRLLSYQIIDCVKEEGGVWHDERGYLVLRETRGAWRFTS